MATTAPLLKDFTKFGRKIVAVGRNYAAHAAELSNPLPKYPLLFLKPTTSYLQAPTPFRALAHHDMHYEIELGVVINGTGTDVSPADAEALVGGYCLAVDMTARDLQSSAKKAGLPWTTAKGMDGFTPVSEFVPKEAVADAANLDIWLKLDGQTKQSGNTKDMIFSIPTLISYISKIMTLERGDVILTGTPEGVGRVLPGQTMTAGLANPGKGDFITIEVPVVEKLPAIDQTGHKDVTPPTMSRLIVKNLPQHYTIERLKEHFGSKGEVTDAKLVKTHDGKFRRFGYVGFKTDKEAKAALKYFNGTFVDTSRIEVELARAIGDVNLARPWSRHSTGSSAFDRKANAEAEAQRQRAEKADRLKRNKEQTTQDAERKQKLLNSLYDDSGVTANDPKLAEFLDVMRPRAAARGRTWANDDVTATSETVDRKPKVNAKVVAVANRKTGGDGMLVTKSHVTFGNDSDDELYDELPAGEKKMNANEAVSASSPDEEEDDGADAPVLEDSVANNSEMSDLEYMRSKMKVLNENEDEEADVEREGDMTIEEMELIDRSALPTESTPIAEDATPDTPSEIVVPVTQAAAPAAATTPAPEVRLYIPEPVPADIIAETGRLFVRNLPYSCSVEDLHKLFEKFGPLTEAHIPIDKLTKKPKGYAFILYLLPEHAVRAFTTLDGTIFQGRILDIIPGKEKPRSADEEENDESSFKVQKERQRKTNAANEFSWNSLFMNSDAVAEAMAKKLGVRKSDILNPDAENMAVRLALAETHIIAETKKYLEDEGIDLSAFEKRKTRSKTVLLVKNIPYNTEEEELQELFGKFGTLGRLVLPPARTIALVEFQQLNEAKSAFQRLAYTKFKHLPLYLEWAPVDTFTGAFDPAKVAERRAQREAAEAQASEVEAAPEPLGAVEKPDAPITDKDLDPDDTQAPVATLFVKNLSFDTTEEGLQEAFGGLRGLRSARVAMKPDRKAAGGKLSMGFGFLEFNSKEDAVTCMKSMQNFSLDGHVLQLKFSNAASKNTNQTSKKRGTDDPVEVTGTKLIVRNIPFEATKKDLQQLFSTFGQLKSVRIPRKFDGQHRGFGFIDFLTKQEAKRAFESLAATHLYGRHLVLEWAQDENSVDAIRDKTAKAFYGDGSGGAPKRRKLVMEGDEDVDVDRMDED
ncbi:hypothetical protein HKX48_006745 [Thoreauomyces humboldtii]|nr:hypothetical protein HKX48_006745 [Thoreauomyces humboldtii]